MSRDNVQVSAIQMSCIANDRKANVKKAIDLIEEAAIGGAQILVLPELFTTGYYCFRKRNQDLFEESETIPGPTTREIGKIAKKYKIYIVSPMFEKASPGIYYNTAPLIGPDGKVIGKYSKTHIPFSGGALEKYYFRPGSKFPVFQTELGNIGIVTCYDRLFPETFRITMLNGAEIVLVPSTRFPKPVATISEDWNFIARTRARENGVFAVFVNRAGEEEGLKYNGHSLIVGPQGDIIAKAGFDECVITASIDLKEVDVTRRQRCYLRDRRPEIYSKLIER